MAESHDGDGTLLSSASWAQNVAAAAGVESYLDLFNDGQLDLLEAGTLSAVCAADPQGLPPQPTDATRKRITEQDSDASDAEEGKACGSHKRPKSGEAAKSKACREKARREKINDRFAELIALIDPGNKDPKTDKPTILADAIKYIQQMRVENGQLSQLNKFLEERVGQLERERGHQLYQHSLFLQHGSMGLMPPGMPLAGSHLTMPGMAPAPANQPSILASPSMAGMAGPSGLQGHLQQSHPHPAVAAAMANAAAAQAHSAHMQAAAAAAAAAAHGHMMPPGPALHSQGLGGPLSMSPAPPLAPHMHGRLLQSNSFHAAASAPHADSSRPPSLHGLPLHTPAGGPVAPGQPSLTPGSDMAGAPQPPHQAAHMVQGVAEAGSERGSMLAMAAAAAAHSGLKSAGSGGGALPGGPALHSHASCWVPPQMLDSAHDSLLRPPAA